MLPFASFAGTGGTGGVLGAPVRFNTSAVGGPPPMNTATHPGAVGAAPVRQASPFTAAAAPVLQPVLGSGGGGGGQHMPPPASASPAGVAPPRRPVFGANSAPPPLLQPGATSSVFAAAPPPPSSSSSGGVLGGGRIFAPAAAAAAAAVAAPAAVTVAFPPRAVTSVAGGPPPPAPSVFGRSLPSGAVLGAGPDSSTTATSARVAPAATAPGGDAHKGSSAFGVLGNVGGSDKAPLPAAPTPAATSSVFAAAPARSVPTTTAVPPPSPFSAVPASATPAAPSPVPTPSAFGAGAATVSSGSGSGSGSGGASVFAATAATAKAPRSSPPPPPTPPISAFAGASTVSGQRRGRSPPPRDHGPASAQPGRAAAAEQRWEVPAPRHGQRHAVARTQQQQQQQQQQRPPPALAQLRQLPIPALPADEKRLCLAARLCKSFLIQLASATALGGGASSGGGGSAGGREADVARTLEQGFFGVVGVEGVHGDFSVTAGEMLALWTSQVRPMLAGSSSSSGGAAADFPGVLWIALFAIGTYLNTIVSAVQATATTAAGVSSSALLPDLAAYKAGVHAHPVEALTDACNYANELSELLQTLYQRGGEAEAPPYSIIPIVLRRVHSVFDEATARGVATVQSNLNAVTSKLFAVLNRRVKTTAVQPLSAAGEAPRWLLSCDTAEKESLLHAFAYVVTEMIAVDAPVNDDVELFIEAFHSCFPSALPERCLLYYRRACALLRQPLRMPLVEDAAALLAKAMVVYPPNAAPHNRRVLLVKLLATELALGRVPPDQDWLSLDVPQLVDVVNALKTSRLDLLDAALSMHGAFFVRVGIHNVLCVARQRLALLLVVKFYLTHGCESRLCVADMVRYHRLPYSTRDAELLWLLPLLVEKQMNGVLDHDFLILSAKTPFDAYSRDSLAASAAR
ncbi:hypothetical protein NESM_000331400 [Novymonas esmeraldas]|uniref:Uncharacterized protein n=1 Tax=Novymonas esmeraldas TaxID=1808958 RepID=A0AAW0EK95_9TRYP